MKKWVHWSHHITWRGAALVPHCLIQVHYVRVCLDLWPPLSYPLSTSSPICFPTGHVTELPFSQLPLLSEVWLIASLCNMLSNLSLLETPLHLTLWSQLLFLENSQFTRDLCLPSLCPRENKSERSSNPSVSQTTPPGWSHKTKGRIPLLPREHPVLVGWAQLGRDNGFCLPDIPYSISHN